MTATPLRPSRKPGLSFNVTSDWLQGRLRVDRIQRDTILAIATAWRDDEAGVMAALDRLADALGGDPSPEELDALVQAAEDTTSMDAAVVTLPMPELARLRDEAQAAVEVTAGRFTSVYRVGEHGRRAS